MISRIRKPPISRFLSSSISGSILLIIATVLAMICANSALSHYYESVLNQTVSLIVGGIDLLAHSGSPMTVARFVNDALMAIFFFAVGLEIKREMLIGELSQVKKALLPIIGAIGGIIIPVIIFFSVAHGTAAESGMAIPMATDIAFSLGVLSMLGSRVPIGLKIFLTALAVVDDLAGILVIAIFYSSHIAVVYLIISVALMVILYVGAKRGINNRGFYVGMGILMWFMFYHSGIHPTIAGVIVAFFVPARPKIDSNMFLAKIRSNFNRFPPITRMSKGAIVLNSEQTDVLHRIQAATDKVISPLQKMEDLLHPVIAFFIIPVFAFVNAGVVLEGIGVDTLTGEATVGVFLGLLFGKFLGIFLFSYLAIKVGIVLLPHGVTMKQLAAVSVLGGIGFTVSLFIANLSYLGIPDIGKELLNQAKLGIIAASVLAGIIGYVMLKNSLGNVVANDEDEYNN